MINKRYIKSEPITNSLFTSKEIVNIEPGTSALHPISTQWVNLKNDNDPICLTKYQILNNESKIFNNYKCKTNVNDYKNFLYVPPIGLSSDDILKIYKLESVNELYNYINDNINSVNYLTIVRLINCWIKVNFDTLKNYNKFLIKIITKLFKFYYSDIIKTDDFDKETGDFIEYWINTTKQPEFKSIIDDFVKHIKKKY
jgi:hypothetical protein